MIIGPDNNGTIRPPDSSKNALVVNATQQSPNQGNLSSGITMFSLDGRRKPDLMAPGKDIVSADNTTACGTRTAGGTSFAAPAVAGVAALVRQYYTEGWYPTGTREPHHAFIPSGALLKGTMINGTVDAAGIAGYPGAAASGEGWGRLLINDALHFANEQRNSVVWDVRNEDGLMTGETVTVNVDVVSNTLPLKVALVWTEPPGQANSATPVVNNLDVVTSVTASPFHPVTSSYNLTNPYDHEALFYFRADHAPPDWKIELNPRKIRLAPGARVVGEITITPPEDARVCTSEWVQVTSWTPRGDTLIDVGGQVVQVDLRRPTVINLKTAAERCDGKDWETIAEQTARHGRKPDIESIRQHCGRTRAFGCLDPPQAGVEVILRYVDPLGAVTFHTVTTDADGCFEDFMASVTGGTWQVTAEYPGGKCDGPASEGPVSVCWCHD